MAMTDWTGAESRQFRRVKDDEAVRSSALGVGILPRALALAIDYVLLLAACAGLDGLLGLTGLDPETIRPLSALLAFVLIVLYFATLESGSRQATLGKLILGLKVTTDEGHRLSFPRAFGRFFAKLLSLIPFGVGFVMAAFTEQHRALHDLLAGTLVVRSRADSRP
ncbi:RDD family protein [Tautonia rosea]|uniref:RDD family protein n=1 Tax=Tautonia rosea TaxID=2728037 RepID=UPI001475C859|nr:RDD family protein [Tautonia rosea]